MKNHPKNFTATYKKEGKWYAGWIEEVPGVNTQGKTLAEARTNLQEALVLVLETNKLLLSKALGKSKVTRETFLLRI